MAQHRAPRKHTGTWIVIAILAAVAYLLSRLIQRGNGTSDQSPDYDRREVN